MIIKKSDNIRIKVSNLLHKLDKITPDEIIMVIDNRIGLVDICTNGFVTWTDSLSEREQFVFFKGMEKALLLKKGE